MLFLSAATTTVGVLAAQPTFTYAGLLTAILAGLNMALRITTYQGLTIGVNQGPITIDAGGTQFTGATQVDGALIGGNVGSVAEPPGSPVARDLTLEQVRQERLARDGPDPPA